MSTHAVVAIVGVASIAIASSVAAQQVVTPVRNRAVAAIPDDLSLLVGKRVIVGRMPLCVPNTYNVNLIYSGKTARVVSFTPNKNLTAFPTNVRLPPSVQATFADIAKGGLILFEFDDGTQLDNCASVGLSTITAQVELAPGETITPVPSLRSAGAPTSNDAAVASSPRPPPPQQCPLSITSLSSGVSLSDMFVEALTTSEFERQIDETMHNGQSKHYLDISVHNGTEKSVEAFEFRTSYLNHMGDATVSATYISQTARPIKPHGDYRAQAMDRGESSQNGAGKVDLYISRVKFDDGTIWQDDGTKSCSRLTASG